MKFDPCTCSADKVCIACRELEAIFDKAERDALVMLGEAVLAAAHEHRVWPTYHQNPGE